MPRDFRTLNGISHAIRRYDGIVLEHPFQHLEATEETGMSGNQEKV